MFRRLKKLLCIGLVLMLCGCGASGQSYTSTTVAMDTIIDQTAYGPNAEKAMRQVNTAFAEYSDRLSLFARGGDIARINAEAGTGWTTVAPETATLIRHALELSEASEGAFAITIAPLTLAWGITTEHPRVPTEKELAALLPLVDDTLVQVEGNRVKLAKAGMGLDLGGIAKGAACTVAQQIYEENGVQSAHLSIGGNVYARGHKPEGKRFKIGFADPNRKGGAFIASFELEDDVVAVSGGYERFFEADDGQRYIHIIDPRTGHTVQSDIVSVGAFHPDGAVADFWSTTLFIWGRDKTLEYMKNGGTAIMLANDGVLYVSKVLQNGFELHSDEYTIQYI